MNESLVRSIIRIIISESSRIPLVRGQEFETSADVDTPFAHTPQYGLVDKQVYGDARANKRCIVIGYEDGASSGLTSKDDVELTGYYKSEGTTHDGVSHALKHGFERDETYLANDPSGPMYFKDTIVAIRDYISSIAGKETNRSGAKYEVYSVLFDIGGKKGPGTGEPTNIKGPLTSSDIANIDLVEIVNCIDRINDDIIVGNPDAGISPGPRNEIEAQIHAMFQSDFYIPHYVQPAVSAIDSGDVVFLTNSVIQNEINNYLNAEKSALSAGAGVVWGPMWFAEKGTYDLKWANPNEIDAATNQFVVYPNYSPGDVAKTITRSLSSRYTGSGSRSVNKDREAASAVRAFLSRLSREGKTICFETNSSNVRAGRQGIGKTRYYYLVNLRDKELIAIEEVEGMASANITTYYKLKDNKSGSYFAQGASFSDMFSSINMFGAIDQNYKVFGGFLKLLVPSGLSLQGCNKTEITSLMPATISGISSNRSQGGGISGTIAPGDNFLRMPNMSDPYIAVLDNSLEDENGEKVVSHRKEIVEQWILQNSPDNNQTVRIVKKLLVEPKKPNRGYYPVYSTRNPSDLKPTSHVSFRNSVWANQRNKLYTFIQNMKNKTQEELEVDSIIYEYLKSVLLPAAQDAMIEFDELPWVKTDDASRKNTTTRAKKWKMSLPEEHPKYSPFEAIRPAPPSQNTRAKRQQPQVQALPSGISENDMRIILGFNNLFDQGAAIALNPSPPQKENLRGVMQRNQGNTHPEFLKFSANVSNILSPPAPPPTPAAQTPAQPASEPSIPTAKSSMPITDKAQSLLVGAINIIKRALHSGVRADSFEEDRLESAYETEGTYSKHPLFKEFDSLYDEYYDRFDD